jgi:hypothetical protein
LSSPIPLLPIRMAEISLSSWSWDEALRTNGGITGVPGVAPTSLQCSPICTTARGHARAIPNRVLHATTPDVILKILPPVA